MRILSTVRDPRSKVRIKILERGKKKAMARKNRGSPQRRMRFNHEGA
jgi:hypothetical protein